MSNNNPYGQAVNAYGSTAAATDPRSLEGQILLKAATRMDVLCQQLDAAGGQVSSDIIGETMEYNRKLWTVFLSDTMNDDHPLPQDIKNNIASLAVFVFKRTTDIMIDPNSQKIRALIDINRNIAAGLMKRPTASTSEMAEATPATARPTDSSA